MQVLAQVLTKLPSWLVPLGSALLHYSLEANQSMLLNISIFLNFIKRLVMYLPHALLGVM